MTDFERLLTVLTHAGVEFIVIGGFAATAHGSAHVTVDLARRTSSASRSSKRCGRKRHSGDERTLAAVQRVE